MSGLFLKVDKDLFGSGLNPTEMLILAQVIEFHNNNLVCYMTDKQFADNFGISESTVSRAIKRLDETFHLINKNTTQTQKGKKRYIVPASVNLTVANDDNKDPASIILTVAEEANCLLRNKQNDIIKDNEKDNEKDNFTDGPKAEAGSSKNPIAVKKEWLAERHNYIQTCANGLFYYNNKYYRIEEAK